MLAVTSSNACIISIIYFSLVCFFFFFTNPSFLPTTSITHAPAYCVCIRQSSCQQRNRAWRHSRGKEEETKGNFLAAESRCWSETQTLQLWSETLIVSCDRHELTSDWLDGVWTATFRSLHTYVCCDAFTVLSTLGLHISQSYCWSYSKPLVLDSNKATLCNLFFITF